MVLNTQTCIYKIQECWESGRLNILYCYLICIRLKQSICKHGADNEYNVFTGNNNPINTQPPLVLLPVDYCKCILIYSPLNSYLYVHWILDFK